MKKSRVKIGLIYGLLAAAVLTVFLVIKLNVFTVYLVLNHDGYLISQDEISKKLFADSLDTEVADYKLTPFSVSDIIYKRSGKYYLGEDKIPISKAYPLYINNGTTTMQLDGSVELITDDFEFLKSYPGLYIIDGKSFNPDFERAYRDKFILQSLSNGLYVNTKDMTLRGNFFIEKTIPINSIIRFMENEIRYYSINGNKLTLSYIKPLNSTSVVTIEGKSYSYYDFLERLGLYEREKLEDRDTESGQEQDSQSEDNAANTPTPTPPAEHIRDVSVDTDEAADEQSQADPALVPVEPELPTSQEQEPEDNPTPTKQPAKTPKPAKPAEPAKPVQLPEMPDYSDRIPTYRDDGDPGYTDDDEQEEDEKEWKKPVVSLENFSTSVYSIYNNLKVDNAEFLYRSGVSFSIYEGSLLVMRKSYTSSEQVKIGPLKPDTEYRVEVIMSYINEKGRKEDEFITEAVVRTRPLNELEPIKLTWINGDIYYNKLELKDLAILNAIKNIDSEGVYLLNENVQYLNRIELQVTGRDDNSLKYTFSMNSKDLNDLRNGRYIIYTTLGNIKSDTWYHYEFVFYDRFGNVLPTDGLLRGTSHTCKQPPVASIRLLKNEVKNIELSIKISNPDNAEIADGSIYFALYDMEDNPVETIIARMAEDGSFSEETETGYVHSLPLKGDTIRFTNLLDHQVYNIRVYCSYDIHDNKGMYENAIIGELKFTTVPITALGYAFFDVIINNLDDKSANLTIKLDKKRTDQRLVDLISHIDIAFAKADTMESEGISVYHEWVADGTAISIPEQLPENNGLVSLSADEVFQMKQGEDGAFTFYVSNLLSMTEYRIIIMPRVLMGTGEHELLRDIKTHYVPDSFLTLKRTPVIEIDAIYASTNFINFYGVSVNDPDKAVVKYPVTIMVYDEEGRYVSVVDIISEDKVELIEFAKLELGKLYTFRFFAYEFNNGTTMATYRKNYELYYSELFESKQYLQVATRESITGSIRLLQLNRNKINYQTEYLAKDETIKSHTNKVYLYNGYRFTSNSVTKAKYSVEVDFGQNRINSFQIYSSYVNPTTYTIYLEDPDANPYARPIGTTTVSDKTISAEYARWSELVLFDNKLELTGKHTLYIVADTGGNGGINYLFGFRFLNAQISPENSYYANIEAIITDVNKELADASYMLNIYKDGIREEVIRHTWRRNSDGTYTLDIYRRNSENVEYLAESRIIDGSERSIFTNLYYEVDKGYHTYRFELFVRVFTYEIRLGSEEFTTEQEIIGIKTEEDLLNVRFGLNKKYYVLNDIEASTQLYRISNYDEFQGELDFRGHKLIYNSKTMFLYKIGSNGKLKNMVFTYNDAWGKETEQNANYLINANLGKIQNIMLILNNGNAGEVYRNDVSGFIRHNYESGIIENFVVKLKDPYIATNHVAGFVSYNRGIIRNGYIYGQPIKMTNYLNLTEQQYSADNYIGGLVTYNRPGGIVENVYTLIDIHTRENLSANDSAATIVSRNYGEIRNSFSVGDVYYAGKIRKDYGPAYRNARTTSMASNVFYHSDEDYGNTNNTWIAKPVLHDRLWYEHLFNDPHSSKSNQFDLTPVRLGFYPHVKLSGLMPAQEYIPLPALTTDSRIEILSSKVIEQGDEYAKAIITFRNPDKLEITGINVRWLNTEILSQEEDGDFYRVTVLLTLPEVTKYYSEYVITSFKYSLGFSYLEYTKEYYDEEKAPTIAAEFYMPISSFEEWVIIKNDYEQNYRLITDIDFNYRAPRDIVLPGDLTVVDISTENAIKDAFRGKLDGNGFRIRFVDTGEYGYVIGKLLGTVKNLTVERLNLKGGNSLYKGFIGRMLEGSVVDNVHILGMEAISYQHCGAIAGDAYAASIVNSSAHNVVIKSSVDGSYTQFIGGLLGRHKANSASSIYGDIKIYNSYVDGVDIEALSAGDIGGVGGLVGLIRASAEINNVYVVNGSIKTVFKNAGGLIGSVDTLTTSDASRYILKNFYVDVDIHTTTDRAGGVIGYTYIDNSEDSVNGLVLGDVSSTMRDAVEVGRFFGYNRYPYSNIYGYELSRVNGAINNDKDALRYSELTDPATYMPGGKLYWEDAFEINPDSIALGIMPKLMDYMGKNLVPYQEDYYVPQNPIKVSNVTSRNYSTGELFVVQIETQHNPAISVEGASFDGLIPAGLADDVKIVRNDEGTVTYLEYILKLNGYFDAYYLTGLSYKDAGGEDPDAVLVQEEHLSVGIAPQYLEISSADDWNQKMASENFGLMGYNVKIIGDLDFSEYGGAAARNVIVNNLIGSVPDEGQWKAVKNINMTTTEPLIAAAYGKISYLSFENIRYNKSDSSFTETFGLFGSVTGAIENVKFSNIDINAKNSNYVGIAGISYGNNNSIYMENVNIKADYSSIPAKRGAGGLVGRLSGSASVKDTKANNIAVEGRGYVGGLVGVQENGKNLWNNEVNNALVSSILSNDSKPYIGGIAGYVPTSTLSRTFGNNRVYNSVILGSNYIGGIVGRGITTGDDLLTEYEDDSYRTQVDNVFIVGLGHSVGGVAGGGRVKRAEVRDSIIYGLYNVGGVTGSGSAIYSYCLDSVISTPYDKEDINQQNIKFQNAVRKRINEVGADSRAGIVLNYLLSASRINTYSNLPSSGSNNSIIGGISGKTISAWNTISANCTVGAFGARDVGGIVGKTETGSSEDWPYRVVSSGSFSSNVYGASNIGGIVGNSTRGYIANCYSNSDVTATKENAGGIVGYIKGAVSNQGETPYVSKVYYAGRVTAPSYAAGVVGGMGQTMFSLNDGWLMIGDVVVQNAAGKGDFFINKMANDISSIRKAMVYKGSSITFGETPNTAEEYFSSNPNSEVTLADTATLQNKNTYTGYLGWNTETASSSSRFYNYSGLTDGYMPYLTHAPENDYNSSSAVTIMNYQKGYKPDDKDPTKPAVDENGKYIYKKIDEKGGIPIPGAGKTIIKRTVLSKNLVTMPRPEVYTSDADKVNIEFTAEDQEAILAVYAGGILVAETDIDRRTFTIKYDFRSELEIVIRKDGKENKYSFWPEDIARNVMTWEADYYYITGGGIAGSKELAGTFVNIYNGKALSADGKVYDLRTAEPIDFAGTTRMADSIMPLHSFSYDGYMIDTFANYSVVDDTVRSNMRLYVKNGEVTAISSHLDVVKDSIIIDSYNGDKYCIVLADGMIVNMTDSKVNMPKEFINEDIQYMTHNINSNSHILLVRYFDGAVAGFNYITGEPLPIISPRGTSTNLIDPNAVRRRTANTSMTNFADLYKDAILFETSLDGAGWAEINGSNINLGWAVPEKGLLTEYDKALMDFEEDLTVERFEADKKTLTALEIEQAQAANQERFFSESLKKIKVAIEEAMELNGAISETQLDAIAASLDYLKEMGVPLDSIAQLEEKLTSLANLARGYSSFDDPNSPYFDGFANADLLSPEEVAGENDGNTGNSDTANGVGKELTGIADSGENALPTDADQASQDAAPADKDIVGPDKPAEDEAAGGGDGDVWDELADDEAESGEDGFASDEAESDEDGLASEVDSDDVSADEAAAVDELNEDKAPSDQDTEDEATADDDKNNSDDESEGSEKESKKAANEKTTKIRLVPVYDVVETRYLLYEEKDLLTREDKELVSVNEKLEKTGRMVDYRPRSNADISSPGDSNVYGYILLSIAITGVALLLGYLLYKKHKEAML